MKKNQCLNDFGKYVSFNVLGMLGLSCYILADTFFIAKGLGTNGLTALNLAIPVYSFIHGAGLMLGVGGGIKYAIQKSQAQQDKGSETFTSTVFIGLCFALIFMLIGAFLSGGLTHLLGADDAVFKMTKTYLTMILVFSPAFILNNILICFVRNDGAPALSMIAMVAGSLCNILLDWIFVFLLKMGIFGAVFATCLAPIISIMILSTFFIRKKNQFKLVKCKASAHLTAIIISSGVPSLLTEISSGIVIIVFNKIILSLEGNVGVAAYGIIANISVVVISIFTGIAQGIQPIISQNFGHGKLENVSSILKYAVISVGAIFLAVYAAIFFGATPITTAFNSEHNAHLQEIALKGLKIYFIGALFAGANIVFAGFFTSKQQAAYGQIISALRGFLIIIPLSFIFSALWGIVGMWWVFPATELATFAISIVLISRKGKSS